MPDHDNNFYSEPVQEIMGKVPSWITRWGVTVIAGIFAVIIIGCCIIKYPQTITSTVTLSSYNPPSDLAARYDGLLDSVFVSNGQAVRHGQLIALLSTHADYGDITTIELILESHSENAISLAADSMILDNYRLGDIQSTWGELVRKCTDYMDWIEIDRIGIQKRLVSEQIDRNIEYYNDLLYQRTLIRKDLEYEKRTFKRDSLLMLQEAISESEYEASAKSLVNKESSLAAFDASLTSARLNVLQLRQQLIELDIQRHSEESEYESTIIQLTRQMKTMIAEWKQMYAIVSPSNGVVSLQSVWSSGQHVTIGDVIASVVPSDGNNIIGRLLVPSSGFGKVEKGQMVNVKLNGFPYMEFGVLKGMVKQISAVPRQISTSEGNTIAYTVDIIFPGGLVSTYGKLFPIVQQMDGTAEIITKDRRLIEQFIDPIISLFRNR